MEQSLAFFFVESAQGRMLHMYISHDIKYLGMKGNHKRRRSYSCRLHCTNRAMLITRQSLISEECRYNCQLIVKLLTQSLEVLFVLNSATPSCNPGGFGGLNEASHLHLRALITQQDPF